LKAKDCQENKLFEFPEGSGRRHYYCNVVYLRSIRQLRAGVASIANAILTHDQSSWVVAGLYMVQGYIAGQRPEEGNSLTNKHWHAGNDQALHQSSA
jgi:hypothetical protein